MRDFDRDTYKDVESLPDEVKDALKDGSAIAVEQTQPRFTNLLFTVALALIVVATTAPAYIGFGWAMHISLAAAAAGWMFLFKVVSGVFTRVSNHQRVSAALSEAIIVKQQEVIENLNNKIDGTNDPETCLTTTETKLH
jgi:hypothetical protein